MNGWRFAMLVVTAPVLMAAARDRELNLQVPSGFSVESPLAPRMATNVPPAPRYQPAPLPDRDAELAPPKASNAPSLAPTLFTRPNEYRGDGFSKGSTAQSEQERRVHPGAGMSLHLPLSSN